MYNTWTINLCIGHSVLKALAARHVQGIDHGGEEHPVEAAEVHSQMEADQTFAQSFQKSIIKEYIP